MGNESISSSRDVGSVSQHIEGVLAGKLLIGGGRDTSLVLSGFTVARNGTSGLRTFRLLKSGDYSAYSGKACAVVFDDSAPSPRAQEAVFAQRSVVPHAKDARCFVHCRSECLMVPPSRCF
jgi:hypothetical protein